MSLAADTPAALQHGTIQPKMSGKQRRVYKCSTCARVFKRSEHCSRHERIHTRERPFACQYCHKKYARKDLVTRHEKTLHSEKRRQSIATAVPESPGSRGSSETSETINVSVPSNPSSQPDVSQLFEAEQEIQPIVTLAENHASIAASAELSPHQLAVADERRNSQILIPADVATPSFGFGNTVETLYPSPQSCPEQAQVNFQPWGEQIVALQEVPMQGAYMPIDPQLCEPQPPLDFNITGHRGSQGSQAAVPSIESRNDSMDAAQDSMGPPTKRRRLTSNGSQTVDTQRPLRQDWQNDLESTSIDIFRDFWSPPEPPSDLAQNSMDSLEFSIPIDPFLMGGQDLSSQQQNGSLFSTNFAFGNQSIDFGSSNWQSFLEGASQASQEKNQDPPKLAVSESTYRSICGDLQARVKKDDWDQCKLPSAQELQKFIESYISCFHRHFPIIHFPTLKLDSTPSPLTLAICCIGALYRLDRRRATMLFDLANPLLHSAISASRRLSPPAPGPLWAVQGSLLLGMHSVFSGRSTLVLSNIERTGLFVAEYRLRRTSLVTGSQDAETRWEDWVIKESNKRLLCGILILSNLISVTYGTNPWFSVGEDLHVELPAKENRWDAQTAGEWVEAKKKGKEHQVTIKDALSATLSQDQPEFPPKDEQRVSGFANLVIAHAANIHIWHLSQLSQCFGNASLPGASHTLLVSDVSSSIDRCQHALSYGRIEDFRHPYSSDAQSSLIFNTNALIRIANTRLFGNADSFNRFILTSDNKHEISTALGSYLSAPQARNAFTTKGAAQAYEGFTLPAKVGPMLVRKTAAFGWSIEHAVAWWDTSLFLTKWVHTLQVQEKTQPPDAEEKKVLEQVKTILGEMEHEYDGEGSLAAAVARACATYLSDTWVWGVTPRMGSVLTKLADAYEKNLQEETARS